MLDRPIRKLLGIALSSLLIPIPGHSLQGPQPRPQTSGQAGSNRPGNPGRPGGSSRPSPGGGSNRPQPARPNPGGNRPQPSRPNPGGNRPQPSRPNPGGNRPQPSRPNPGGNRPQPSRPNPGNGRPPARPGNRPPQWGRPPQQRPSYQFRPHDRDYLRRYYGNRLGYINRSRRPSFIVGGYFPYGDIGYLTPVPPSIYGYLPPPPPGYQVGYFDGYVVVYDPLTYFIANVVDLLQ